MDISKITAAALDAIIGSMVTPPDALVKVYGQRVSEICSTPSSNPRGSWAHGMFQNYVGADSTTIWAAVTSGKGALAVHLLACMLARLWTPAEATSIWVEIVEERKAQISAECDPNEPSHYALIRASHLEVTRAELANWDAGARAWLAIADKPNQRQHSQLRLKIENLSISVNNNSVVFSSVIKAWQSAMEMVQNLLMGISQRVNSGAVLLALSAWHLYPDMDVFCVSNKTVEQEDALMSGAGRLIVGLEDADPSYSTGIFWSLSLSHLRYYGDPVLCRRSVAEDASRVSFNEFTLVALGCLLQRWCTWTQDGLAINSVVEMIISLGDFVGEVSSTFSTNMDMPIAVWRAAHTLARLSSGWMGVMGTRRGATFLGPLDEHPPRLFGLSSPQVVLNLLRDDAECQIDAMRAIVRSSPDVGDSTMFIGYTHECQRLGKWQEFTTVVPIATIEGKKKHVRWVPADVAKVKHNAWLRLGEDYNTTRFDEVISMGEVCELYYPDSLEVSQHDLTYYLPLNLSRSVGTAKIPISIAVRGTNRREPDPEQPLKRFRYPKINDNPTIAVYAAGICVSDFEVFPENLTRFFDDRYFDVEKLEVHLTHVWFAKASPEYVRSMRALARTDQIYKLMPNASVSLSVLRKELGQQKWVPCEDDAEHPYEDDKDDEFVIVKRNRSGFEVFDVARSESFSCVALFETGTMDLSPDCFTNVMAISSGNFIFASSSILCDPWEDAKPHEIQRLVANIGKSGLSFTRYEGPVPGAVFHGAQDVEANYVETLAQVYDGSKWVGDIDILGALSSNFIERISLPHPCQGHPSRPKPRFRAVSIDNWDELIDAPSTAGVIRAHDNFVGRLAATAISVQKGHLTFVLPKQICWTCIESFTLHSLDELSGGIFIG
ncbi:unnamed protein product [Aspergillus oryzae]|uniref:Unnamed protein product n=1 Tax=Aspergillus oryzae var. brunneus TaxID=332754 RepID=A0ABQ6KE99_ASPOZ|nr:unnamed protein product [Aspergillus oryzae]GMF83515.1 unnamed protein product [Aspergillus oryzae]GMG41962.1 unnamed protein product [Aspergillus oryzae var. brunneus]